MSIPLQIRAQAAVAQLLYALPRPVRRLIAGRPVRLDGQELALDAQLLLRLQQLTGASFVSDTVERSRRDLDAGRHLVSGPPIEPVSTREVTIPGDGGEIPA